MSFFYNAEMNSSVFFQNLQFDPPSLLHLGTKEYSICNQSVLFAQLENANKLWNNNRNMYANERN